MRAVKLEDIAPLKLGVDFDIVANSKEALVMQMHTGPLASQYFMVRNVTFDPVPDGTLRVGYDVWACNTETKPTTFTAPSDEAFAEVEKVMGFILKTMVLMEANGITDPEQIKEVLGGAKATGSVLH